MKKKKSQRQKKFVYIRMTSYSATVYLSYKPWNEMFGSLANDSIAECNSDMKEHGLIGKGEVYWDRYSKTYYCTSTWVRSCYRNEGNGILLYKALMLGAVKLAKKKGGKITFSSHEAAGASTSKKAWRVYKSLHRLGYLELKRKRKSNKLGKKDKFVIARLPKNFKPLFYEL